jgi:hypothetical protein
MRAHLVGWGLACLLTSNLAVAQDGQPPVGPPVTAPGTDKDNPPRTAPLPPRAQSSNEVLPPVPATASDPAPPGTRAVRVDTPVPVEAAPSPDPTDVDALVPGAAAPVAARPARASAPGSEYVEGVVTSIKNAGTGLMPDARVVITLDHWRTWDSYLTEIGQRPRPEPAPARPLARAAQRVAQAVEGAVEKAAETGPFPDDRPREITLVLTRRSHLYGVTRTPDGMDVYGANPAPALGDRTANIGQGSFVAVRYRPLGGDQNAVLNLSVINPQAALAAPRTAGVPRTAVPGRSPIAPGVAVPGRPLPDPTLTNPPASVAPGVNPTRIPRVPTQESSPGTLPH